MNNQEVFKAMQQMMEVSKSTTPDTSSDGVYILETDEGSCIQIINNGAAMLMSHDLYNQLLSHPKLSEAQL